MRLSCSIRYEGRGGGSYSAGWQEYSQNFLEKRGRRDLVALGQLLSRSEGTP
jgi:hypothetical protein